MYTKNKQNKLLRELKLSNTFFCETQKKKSSNNNENRVFVRNQ